MIIDVKSARSDPGEKVPGARYALKEKRESKTPYAFALFLIGIGLYLKSIFPGQASQERGLSPDEDDKKGRAERPTELAQADEVDRHIQTGTTPPAGPATTGSGSRLIDLQPPARFFLVDTPEVGGFLPPESPLVWMRVPPAESLPANDNSSAGGIPVATPPSSGPGNPANPVAPVEPTGPGGPGQPEEPGGPVDPQEPCGEMPGSCDGGPAGPCDDAPVPQPPDQGACGCGKEKIPATANRAPRVAAPAVLADIASCSFLVIGLADLLRHATDPDGDALSVINLTTSSGTLLRTVEGWIYTPDPFFTGAVTLTYDISDGALAVEQVAHFSVGRGLVAGTDCDDVLTGTMCADDIAGGAGNDLIKGLGGNDVIYGEAGDDTIFGGDGDDVIFGGDGDDVIFGGAGNDRLSGGAGNDRIFGEAGDDIIFGEDGDDYLDGGDGDDVIFGGAGDDIIHGGAGDDVLDGGDGDDRIFGGDGNDVIRDGFGSDVVHGGAGDDYVIAALDQADDIYDGGEGRDTLDYSAATQDLTIDLVAGVARGVEIGNDTISGFEIVLGGAGDDHFIVGDTAVTLGGGGGENIFEFTGPQQGAAAPEPLMFEILDFKAGDRIRMSKYDLFEKVFDRFEDEFEKIYGKDIDDDDVRIRFRHERDEQDDRTIIEADFNRDDVFETTIVLQGRHLLVIVDNA